MATIIETTDAPNYAYLPFAGGPYTLLPADTFIGSLGGDLLPSDVNYAGPGTTDTSDEIYLSVVMGRTYQIGVTTTDPSIGFEIFDPSSSSMPQPITVGTALTFTFATSGQMIFTAFRFGGFLNGSSGYQVTLTDITPDPTIPSIGDDILSGTSGRDTIDLLDGADFYDAGDNHDSILAGDGNDTVLGGGGKDSIVGGGGNDELRGGLGNDTILGQAGDDLIDGYDGNDLLNGGGGADTIYGGGGRDTIIGGNGKEYVDAGTGNDSIIAGDGQDTIIGGEGHDTMSGGTGADVFVFGQASGLDTITDFTQGADLIDLSAMGITDISGLTLEAQGSSVLFTFSLWDRLVVQNAAAADFDASDFVFADDIPEIVY